MLEIHSRAESLVIQDTIIWTFHSTKNWHEMSNSSCSAPEETGYTHLPLPGQLSDQSQVPTGDGNNPSAYTRAILALMGLIVNYEK